jgi:uncharacterized secreted protein with C-terminal beta-propeller domain
LLDLANPADPRIAGELEIPGFSEFLHPVTQDLLLGLGAEAGNTKLALFDVSQIGQPQAIPASVAQLPSNGVYVTPCLRCTSSRCWANKVPAAHHFRPPA